MLFFATFAGGSWRPLRLDALDDRPATTAEAWLRRDGESKKPLTAKFAEKIREVRQENLEKNQLSRLGN